jgi:hypothetical protein
VKAGRKTRGDHVFLEQLEALGPEQPFENLDPIADANPFANEQALLSAGDMGIWGELYKSNLRFVFEANQALLETFAAHQIETDVAAEPLHIADAQGGTESFFLDLWTRSTLLQRW